MLLRLIRLARPLVLLLALCAPSLVQAGTCDLIFVGQQPPALVNPNLAQRTTLLCNDAFAALALASRVALSGQPSI